VGRRIESWIELLQSLREAFIGVMQAEVRSLRVDFELSKRHLGRALGLSAVAIFVVFWVIGVMVLLLIQVAGIWLPAWAASLVVLVFLAILAMGLFAGAKSNFERIEAPKAMIRRHVQEHMDWWEDEILPASRGEVDGSLTPGGGDSDAEEENL
jgi:uncharacterized membrane protein YqjE